MISNPIELFKSLNRHEVRYLIIGGMAAITYGVPRVTKDIDLFIEASESNCQHLLHALEEVGMGTALLTTPAAILKNEITIFDDYWRIDVLTLLRSITFEKAFANRTVYNRDSVELPFISISDLIQEKYRIGRPGDLEDAQLLEEILTQQRTN